MSARPAPPPTETLREAVEFYALAMTAEVDNFGASLWTQERADNALAALAALSCVEALVEAAQAVDEEHEAGLSASIGAAERLHVSLLPFSVAAAERQPR